MQYRHIIPANPEALVCNCNLYTLVPDLTNQHERVALAAILNSTIVGLFKCFYGRYAGTEGNLKTEVVDTVLLEIPDPRGVSPQLAERLSKALQRMIQREVTHLVDEAMLQCHSAEAMREILRRPPELPSELCHEDRRELDDCVIELIGVSDKKQRQKLLDELYRYRILPLRAHARDSSDGKSLWKKRPSSGRAGLSRKHLEFAC